MYLDNYKKIHCIGIGGIGVSAIAQIAKESGSIVSGSDLENSELIQKLIKEKKINIQIGSHPEMIDRNTNCVIYSPAVPKTNPEYQKAQSLNIPLYSYPEMLGRLSENKKTITVSGTNGKTTTTTMIAEVMEYLDKTPNLIVGALLQKYDKNYLTNQSEYFLAEACEYKRSFLNIHHDIAVITNITPDHLDYFKDLSDIQSAFCDFLNNKKGSGILICDTTLENLKPIIEKAKSLNITIINYQKYVKDISSKIIGQHTVLNIAAALGAIEALGLDTKKAQYYLENEFKGAQRRLEYLGKTDQGSLLYDDYAHNPEGLELLLQGIKNHYPEKKIVLLFEPHLYSRTEDFKEEFGKVLSKTDILHLFPVYKAREKEQKEKDFLLEEFINLDKKRFIVEKKPEDFIKNFHEYNYNENHIIVSAGAGPIWKYTHALKKED